MKLPDGVVGLRKVRTVFGGEDGRTHLTWVLAYNAGIEIGSPHYEAIRAFAGRLKAPPGKAGMAMEHSVMFLPVAPPDTNHAPPAGAAPPRKPRAARPKKSRRQPAAKRVAKSSVRRTPKTVAKRAAKRASRTRKPARSRRPSRR